jgi:probable phosphoglycerate mutase
MTELYLIRHGETDWNRERRIQGSTDIPLNEIGRAQAETTGRLLSRRPWDAIVASPLSRARETATIIAGEVGLPAPATRPDLVERRYGEAEGLDWQQVEARFPGATEVPGRETRQQVTERVIPALLAIAAEHPGESVLVVTHGGVIRAVLGAVDPDNQHGPITNGSVHSFRLADGSLELIAFDDPIDSLSLEVGTDDIDDQNALEHRDTVPR